jgi:AcrR family transcriptional regulator
MSPLSTAETRKPVVVASALREFARGGYYGATIADVARASGISPAYVFKLFPSKELLFVSALEDCFRQIIETFAAVADGASDQSPDGILDAMGASYAELISDRDLIMLQVHAQAVASVPEIGQAYRAGIASITLFMKSRSGADDSAVQHAVAFGQLCHLIVTAGLATLTDDWALILSHGIRHP